MANSPLDFFRTHQKVLLAVFGVLLMVGFLIGGAITRSGGDAAASNDNAVVVKLQSGDLTESDLQNLRYARYQVRNFMQSVRMIAAQKGATPQQSLGVPDTDDEENLVQTAILAKQARDLGIEVSDEAIIRFLEGYAQGTLQKGEFARILQTSSQNRMPQNQFFDAMRRELLALRYLSLFQRGMLPPTPHAAWDYYQRLNRRLTFEAVPFPVADYLGQTQEPSESEIAKTFEEGKRRYPLPDRAEPGFRRLKKIAVEYVKADLAQYMPAAKAQITDADVSEYYEQNKEQFRNISLPTGPGLSDLPGLDAAPTTPGTPPLSPDARLTEPGADLPLGDGASGAAPGANDSPLPIDLPETPPTTDLPGADLPGADLPGADLPLTPPGSPPSERPLQDDPAETGPKVNSAPDGELPDASATETPTAETPPTETPAAEPPAADTTTPATEPAATDAQPTETEPALPADDTPAAADDTSDPLGDLPEAPGGNAPTGPDFKPLTEVADEIRSRLAAPIARQRMEEALNVVRAQMRTYYGSFIAWDRSPDKAKLTQPAPPDLRALAQEQGLTFGTVPMVDVLQLQETDSVTGTPLYEISMAYELTQSMARVPFAQQAFDDSLGRFQTRSIPGAELDTEFLFWKSDDSPERIPELADVRDEVVRALKLQQALTFAKDAAKQAAEQIQQSGKRPEELFQSDPNRKVLKAESLTWMTSANVPGYPPMITRVPGVRYPSDEFMKSIFSLDAGQTGVAVDSPQTTVYAVAVLSVDSNDVQMRDEFFRAGPNIDTLILAQQDNQLRLQQWYTTLTKQLGLTWEREPQRDSRMR